MEEEKTASFDLEEVLSQAKEEATAQDSQPEQEPEGEEPADTEEELEEDSPEYKKNAKTRIQELLKERKEQQEQLRKLEEEFGTFKKQLKTEERNTAVPQADIPKEFVDLYGYNVEAWNLYQGLLDKKIKQETGSLASQIKEEIRREQEEVQARNNEIQREIDDYASEHRVNKTELRKFAAENPIFRLDDPTKLDFQKIHKFMRLEKGTAQKSDAKKKLASINSGDVEKPVKQTFSPSDYK